MNESEIKIGSTYRMSGQHRLPHRVLSIGDHPRAVGDKRVGSRVIRSDGSIGVNKSNWSLRIFAKTAIEEILL